MKLLGIGLTTTALLSAAPAVNVLPATSSGAACAQICGEVECDQYGCADEPFSICTGSDMVFVEEDKVCLAGQHQSWPMCEVD